LATGFGLEPLQIGVVEAIRFRIAHQPDPTEGWRPCNAVTDMMKEDPDAVRELLKRRTQKLN
jgi:hypothetical protein